ncbi:transposase family protein [Micromonospora sp. NBC_01796]|nr:transposase family protein [Micromonospora sp. NBC_01796]
MPCGACGTWSSTVDGRYVRLLADVRLGGHEVLLALTVRRFACVNSGCRRRTFVEQVASADRVRWLCRHSLSQSVQVVNGESERFGAGCSAGY